MSLWGASTTDDNKPKYLSDAEKRDVYATKEGWVKRTTGTGGRAGRVHEEILVAIGELSETFAEANISNVTLVTDSISAGTDTEVNIIVTFNESVTVTGTPHVELTNTTAPVRSANIVYASGTKSNRLTFTSTVTSGTLNENDVVGVALMRLDGGTIVDTIGGANALITFDPIAKQITVGA
jgi:hypothetical protein